MRVVAAVPGIGLLAGAAVGLARPDLPEPVAYLILALGAAGTLWGFVRAHAGWLIVSAAAAFAAGGVLLAAAAWRQAWPSPLRVAFDEIARAQRAEREAAPHVVPVDDEAEAVITGTLRTDASRGPSGVSLSVAVDEIEPGRSVPEARKRQGGASASAPGAGPRASDKGGVLLTVVGSLADAHLDEWRTGRRIRAPVALRRPSRYLDPGVPDYERQLALRGSSLVGTVKSGALVELLARGSWREEAVGAARGFARRAIAHSVGRWNPQSGAIVAAIVIGDRAGLDGDVQRRLQEAGTYHVIAISGGNIAILAGLLLALFRWGGWLGPMAMASSILALAAYAGLVGGGASVDRATLMAVVYFAGRMLDHRGPPLNTLFVVAGLLVAIGPLSVADPAFALTFGATAAILVTASAGRTGGGWFARGPAVARAAIAMFGASLAAEAALLPVGARIFSRVTFAGLGLNFLAIPLMAVAQVAGMLVVPLFAVSVRLAAAAGFVAHVGAAGLVWSADLVRFAPALAVRVAPPAIWVMALYYAGLTGAWILWNRGPWARLAFAAAGLCGAVWIVAEPWALASAGGDGRLHVTFIDVGQGDSIIVRFPRGKTLLVDAGGLTFGSGFDVGDRVVAPVLRQAGIRRLDVLALTHGDPDHIGGAPSVVREFRPREVWEGVPVPRLQPLADLRQAVQSRGAKWANVFVGDRVAMDDVEVTARAPTPPDWERQRVRNDDSLVLELRWRDVSVLLTGDVGRAVERDLARAMPPSRLRVLKVPHHGSLTSSSLEFVEGLRPDVAVVSVGRSNRFGHPAPAVLQRYRDAGSAIFRTDEDGAVTIDTDGRSLDVHTFSGRALHTADHEDTQDEKNTKP